MKTTETIIRCAVGVTDGLKVAVGLHRGQTLRPFFFYLLWDKLIGEVRHEAPWTVMFADDSVDRGECREQVEENLERWRFCLGAKRNTGQQEQNRIHVCK